jgi:cell cycle checkpoint protein
MAKDAPPILTAVSSSARQLFMLLRCIAFSSKAHITIGEEGLKISVNEVSAMEGAFPFVRSAIVPKLMQPPEVPLHHLRFPRPRPRTQPRNLRQ